MPTDPTTPTPSRSLVSRRAIVDVVRSATLGSYGVIGFAGGGPIAWIADRFGLAPRGIQVALTGGLAIDLDLIVAHGLPIAEGEGDRLTIHVDGLQVAAYDVQLVLGGRPREPHDVSTDDLAASGTDVA